MKTWFKLSALAALLAVGASSFAQDGMKKDEAKKDEGCCQEAKDCCTDGKCFVTAALHKELCGSKGECKDEKCKTFCTNISATMKVVGTRCMEACKKEGLKCEGCEKDAKSAPCAHCKELCTKNLVPWLKTQVTTKDATHSHKDKDGKDVSVKCTLTTGPVCEDCVQTMTTLMVKACKEVNAAKKP